MRIYKYFFVGGIAAVVDIGLFSMFAIYIGLPWIPVSICTFIIATYINYLLSIKYVFESGIRYKKNVEMMAVFAISGLALLVNQSVMYMAINFLGWNLIASKIIATITVFLWNYFGRSNLIFK